MTIERVVLDANVVISAALRPQGPPRAVVHAMRATGAILLFSDETFDELRTRLLHSKFDSYISPADRLVLLAQLEAVAEWVSIVGARMGCRDQSDDKLLETALMGQAGCLVTGDRDLLVMSPFHGIPIVSPAEYLE